MATGFGSESAPAEHPVSRQMTFRVKREGANCRRY